MKPPEETNLEVERDGRIYHFSFHSLDAGYEYLVWHESKCVGRVSCGYEKDNSVKLYDINLYSSQGMEHRKQGLGKILLNLALDHAKSRHTARIYGSVISTDIQLKPDLLAWYARNGFRLLEDLDSMGNHQVEIILPEDPNV